MKSTILLAFIVLATGCSKLSEKVTYIKHLNHKAELINHYEKVSLNLAKRNRELEIELSEVKYELQKMKTQNSFLAMKEKEKEGETLESTPSRSIASIGPVDKDFVEQKIYNWSPEQLVATADKEFEEKNYEKAAQFYQTLVLNFPSSSEVDERLLFQAGMAAFESDKHDWTMNNLQMLVKKYPNSKYYRGAKLWMALTNLKLGKKKEFFNTVEEFRKKYRNTQEWAILSAHYENIMQKYKE